MERLKGEVTFVNVIRRCGWITGEDSLSYGFNEHNIDSDFLYDLIEIRPSRNSGVPVSFIPLEWINKNGERRIIADSIQPDDLYAGPCEEPENDPANLMDAPNADEREGRSEEDKKCALSLEQQICHMKRQGVSFELMSESNAVEYLRAHNNYFRVRSYRTGFNRTTQIDGTRRFDRLDFGMLVDLAEIDALLRSTMLSITLDVERVEKLLLLESFTLDGEDAYEIPKAFLAEQANEPRGLKIDALEERRLKDAYARGLIRRYSNTGYPLWAFLELITFGDLVHLCHFCADNYGYNEPLGDKKTLMFVKELRNACAHGSCILNDVAPQDEGVFRSPPAVGEMLSRIDAIGRDQRRQKMKNSRIQQIVTSMYAHSRIPENKMFNERKAELQTFFERAVLHSDYYLSNNDSLFSTLVFLRNVYEYLYA